MREINEQWIENGRMYKAVLQESKIINRVIDGNICHGCCHVDNWDDDCLHPSKLCPLDKGLIAKDLGPVNEDGVLACPFCGGFMKEMDDREGKYWRHCLSCHTETPKVDSYEEAKEYCNRRAM